ncbi:hypothetical protein [Ideonella oryzae]|uniref:Uncharacterized protein n=1 Tax=Ideonella oryzae TaxID=2937441 RepID=A0ABT1BH07_9BURK|nr:hypothetical protein [Ideonella oryzae]MCO5975510.1 hypothetical protein [Ideonella oryzae]
MAQIPQGSRPATWLGVVALYLAICFLAIALAGLQPRSAGAIEEHAVQIAQAAEQPWEQMLPDTATPAVQ